MSGSRTISGRHETGGSSLDALNRTIEGLEARIEDILGRSGPAATGGRPRTPAQAAPTPSSRPATEATLLDGIRARQRTLAATHRGPAPKAPGTATPAPTGNGRVEPRQDIGEALVTEMAALRREMSELRSEARAQALPQDLRRDLAGISVSIDALGAQGDGADALRLELDSIRSMIDRLAREDSVRSLESRWQSVEDQISGFDVGGLREELVNLAYRVDDIREVLATMPATGHVQAIEDKIAELSQSIEVMTRQPAQAAAEFPHQFDQLGARLDEISRAIATMPAPPAPVVDPAPFERLEARLASVAQKIDGLDPATATADFGDRIEYLATRVAQLADDDAVARLDARIERLHAIVENGVRDDRMPELSGYLSDIADKIGMLDARSVDNSMVARLDQLAAQIDNLSVAAAPQPAGVPDAVIGRLEALIGRAEATASRPIDPLPGLETLDAKLADIAARLQNAELTSASVSLQPPHGLEQVEAQLAEISARLDRAPADPGPIMVPGFENLEARLADIADRLDLSSNTIGPSDEALRGLEDQIANLSRLVSATSQNTGAEAHNERFASLEEHLATSDEFIVEAARQAAEAALIAYSNQLGGAPSPQSIANIEVITALADDLKSLESLSRKSDDRTIRAFEAVQDTLLKIAGRLERLDVSPSFSGTAEPAGTREAVSDARTTAETAMPRASTAAMDELMPSLDAGGDFGLERARTGPQDRQPHSPAEAAALAAAFATDQQTDGAATGEHSQTGSSSDKSFLSGLAARIRPGKEAVAASAEPLFDEPDSPPLDPSMEFDQATENMPLEPGSGAPDINRILQKVREAQAVERQRGGNAAENGSEKSEFLASARRAAMAAAAEVETIGKSRQPGAKGGVLEVLKSRRRPILMAAGAVLLAIMSFPLISGLLAGDGAETAVVEPALVAPAAPLEQSLTPAVDGSAMAVVQDPQTPEETRLPEVRVLEPDTEAPAAEASLAVTGMDANAISQEETAAISQNDEPAPAVAAEAEALAADLASLPPAAVSGALKAAAAANNQLAFYEIGTRFTEGRGVPVDLAQAANWYRRAADLGHAPSQYRIANFYEKGSGLDRDLTAAKKWYQMAAEQGNASAMHNLAVLYATAGPAPDFDNAAVWFGRAAEVGVRDSQVNLAILYARGDGVPRDLEQSYKWFAIAANDGDKDAEVKRDEVFNALRPEQAAAARDAVATWTAKPINPDANAVEVPASWGGDSTETASVDMSKAVRNIQAILNNNGFDAGAPDGIIGKKTISAIKAFQSSVGMKPTGEIDDELVKELLARNG